MQSKLIFSTFTALALAAGVSRGQDGPPPLAPLPGEAVEQDVPPASAAPADVVASAVDAVAKLGNEVVLGRYQVAIERMNPDWKERTAARLGGIEVLEKRLAGVAQQMVQRGVSMISFAPRGQPRSFEVGPGTKVEKVAGEDVESLIFTKWLVMIPTVTTFRLMRQGEKPVVIESTGFQVAISEKGANDWSFIDGSGLTVNDLRSLYVTLPKDIEFPPVGKREAR